VHNKSPRKTAPGRGSRGVALALVALGALASHAPRVAAATVCVSNDAQFHSALETARHLTTRIEMVQGTYDLHGSVWEIDNRTTLVSAEIGMRRFCLPPSDPWIARRTPHPSMMQHVTFDIYCHSIG